MKQHSSKSHFSKSQKEPLNLLGSKSKLTQKTPFRALYQYCSQSQLFILLLAIIFTTIFAIQPIFIVMKLGQVIDTMTKVSASTQDFYDQQKSIAIFQFILGVITLLTSWISVALFIKIGNKVGIQWKSRYFAAVMNKPIKWFDKRNAAELGSTLDIDCDNIEHAAGQKLMLVMSGVLLFIASWIYSFYLNLQMTLLAFGMLPFQLGAALTIERASFKASEESGQKYQVAGGIAQESIEGAKTVASYNAQEQRAKAYQQELKPLQKSTTVMGALHGFGWSVFFCVMFVFSGVIFYYGAVLMDDDEQNWLRGNQTEAADVVMIFFATAMSALYLGMAVPCIQYIDKGRIVAAKVTRLIEKTRKFDGSFEPAGGIRGEIQIKNVHFAYPTNRAVPILQGVSFELEPGNSLAIVGETGCGKSTIIQLIQGFYYPDHGQIFIDGVKIEDYSLRALRDHIGLVSQEPLLFNADIKENIRIGNLEATDKEIMDVIAEAEAKYIFDLEKGVNTYVGNKGCQLSGGQKQRVAIARALLKKPKILLLDQATSALDVETEKRIQSTLNKVMLGRTTIIVAQRLSTIKNANSIILLDSGQVVQKGTHQQLLEAGGAYATLVSVQQKVLYQSIKSEKSLIEQGVTFSDSIQELEQEQGKPGEEGKYIKRILAMTKQYWPYLLLAAICAVISGVLFPIFGYFFAENILSLLDGSGQSMLDDVQQNMYYLIIQASIIMFTVTLLCFALARITALFTYKLRYDGLKSLLFYDQKFFDMPTNNPASLAYRLGSDSQKITNIGGPILGIQCLILSSLIGGVVIAMKQDPVFATVILAMVPFLVISNAKGEMLQVEGLANTNLKQTSAIASDSLTNIKTVHSFNRQDHFKEIYLKASLQENELVMKGSHGKGIIFGSRYLVLYVLWGVMSWYGAYRVKQDQMSLQEMLKTFFSICFASWGFMMVGALAPDVEGGIRAAKNMFKMIDYVPEIDGQSLSGSKSSIAGGVKFNLVIFKYEGRNNIILNSVSFNCPAGSTLGITGQTGSGKSTIAQLIMRFYDPSSGNIFIDGEKIQNFNLKHLRESVIWVGQEPILFKGSLLYNLQIAKENITEQEAIAAITKAQGIDILRKYGLYSDVGLRGSKLSGGQKQRVAIARALVKKPKILILDQATSALDNNTENKLQEKLQEETFTVISIAHRLKTIKNYDNILLLNQGVVIEQGSHEQLMNIPNGAYKTLFMKSE